VISIYSSYFDAMESAVQNSSLQQLLSQTKMVPPGKEPFF